METSASLLERLRTSPDEAAWRRLDNLYRPLIRRWLRTITAHRLGAFYRSRQNRPRALGGALEDSPLMQLVDANSELGLQWDQEHDRYVLARLLELIEPLFEPTTLAAFRRVAVDGIAPAQAAEELGLSLNAALIAKSRVLNRLRQEAKGFID